MGAVLALVAAPAIADENIWNIGPRTLPPPANASPELQAIIGAERTPKVMRGDPPSSMLVWKAIIALQDEKGAERAKKIAE